MVTGLLDCYLSEQPFSTQLPPSLSLFLLPCFLVDTPPSVFFCPQNLFVKSSLPAPGPTALHIRSLQGLLGPQWL